MDNHLFHKLPYTHEEIEELLNKLKSGEVLKTADYEKLVNIKGIDNLSTFSGDYNELNNLPHIPQYTSDLTNDLNYCRFSEVQNEIASAVEYIMTHLNEYENLNELEYAKQVAMENQYNSLTRYTDEEVTKLRTEIRNLVDIPKLNSALSGKADNIHRHKIEDVENLQGKLDSINYQITEKLDKNHSRYEESYYLSKANKESIESANSKMVDLNIKIDKLSESSKILADKLGPNHNHDADYADKVFEHHHCNKEVLDQISAELIRKWHSQIFLAYHSGRDENGDYLNEPPKRPVGDVSKGNAFDNVWYTDTEYDVEAMWISIKIAPCIEEEIWSLPMKLMGKVLENIETQYYLSSSETEPLDGEWLDELPVIGDKTLWSRSKFTWKNPFEITYSAPLITAQDIKFKQIEALEDRMSDLEDRLIAFLEEGQSIFEKEEDDEQEQE